MNKFTLIVSEPSAVVFDEMAELGFEYEMEAIATDALIFVVNENNPVDSLTRVLFDWLVTEEGQRLVDREGYVSVMNFEA